MSKKVLVAMSGGVDSSVAAYLLKKEGYECIGCTMKLYANDDVGIPREHTCCTLEDVEDARSVAFRLKMPHYVFNFTESFRSEIMDRFVNGYLSGLTPNPCIDCNRYMKFDLLYKRAEILGCDYVATGHYARIEEADGKYFLKKGLDPTKDQSYVLCPITQEQLAHTLLPLGNLTKAQVRKIAEENGFVNADKPDSQDICFVPDGDYVDFIKRYTGRQFEEGNIFDISGKVVGKHRGAIGYTIGQRKGLGIAAPRPLYVVDKDIEANTVTVGFEESLYKREIFASDMNWTSGDASLENPIRCKAMTRYRKAEQPATVYKENDYVKIVLDEPGRAITPGQAVVLYDGDTVLGGGIITKVK
ncbi:MAG: tRNA 2-thiouridine(34) synthase MnmA [Eubacteriales bacterium]|jgi:tRNA-specific 2-thiouridylase